MSNRARIIDDLISLEAWHEPLEYDCAKPMFVALSFSDARYSGGSDMPVEFTVKLKRARLVVVCDQGIVVPKASKTREHPQRLRSVKSANHEEHSTARSRETQGTLKTKVTSTNAAFDAEMSDKSGDTKGQRVGGEFETSEDIIQTVHMTYKDAGSEHHWECRPMHKDHLEGTGHDGSSHIMELKASNGPRIEDMGVRVFLKCLADDLDVIDVMLKPSFKERFLGENRERRLRLAREVIKEKLKEAQLEVVELEPRFQEVVLADVIAVPE